MKFTLPEDAELLAAFDSEGTPRTLHVMEVLEHLGLPPSTKKNLHDALSLMAERGLVEELPGARFRRSRRKSETVSGRFSQNPRGFGFVTAEDLGADVFIPATAVGGAMHGDRVSARVFASERGREGAVDTVLERRSPRVPGQLRLKAGGAWVEPDDARIRGPIPVERPAEGDDGAAVVCVIERFPSHARELPEGRVLCLLGRPGAIDVETQKVLLRESVDEDFPADALAEAAQLPEELAPADWAGREDLRKVPLLTIDPDDARDHDDAVYVRRRSEGGYTALIAIADVSHYVRPGTAIDNAAASRGTSIYLPDRAIPMLPRELSSNLASLVAGKDRLTLAVEVKLSAEGKVEKYRVFEGVMRTAALVTYTQAAHTLGWTELGATTEAAQKYRGDLEVAGELSKLLRARRMRRGAMDLDLPEGRVKFGEDKKTPTDIVQSRQDPGVRRAYSMVEELMLLANEVVAALCLKRALPSIYRVHGKPESEALERLCKAAAVLGSPIDPEDAADPKKLSRWLRKLAGTTSARLLGNLLLRSLPQAQYHVDNTGHFGLASEAYLHFTSPIRRYPDVAVHRVVRQYARRERIRTDDEAVDALRKRAVDSSRLERRAMEVEREVMDLYKCVVAGAHLNERFEGTVTGLSGSGVYVQLESPFLSILLRTQELAADQWELDELGITLRAERTGAVVKLGEKLTVEIAEVSLTRRTVFGRLVGTLELAEGKPARAKSAASAEPKGARAASDKKSARGSKFEKSAKGAKSKGKRKG